MYLDSSVAQKFSVRITCVGIVITALLDHPTDYFFLLELVLGDVLLCPEEPGDGHDNVKVVECWKMVEADPA